MTKKTSSCLIDEPPIAFLPTLAKIAGVDGALVLQQIHFWLIQPKIGRMVDDAKWVRNSLEEWQRDNFPFWSKSKISRIITKLEDMNLIVSRDDLNRHGYDRTKWYTIHYGNLQNCKMHVAELQDAVCRNDTTIPEITLKITTETTLPPPPPMLNTNGTHKANGSHSGEDSPPPSSDAPPSPADVLAAWARLFPNKSQPRESTYKKKIQTRLKSEHFRENWLVAMERAAESPSCQSESWFHFEFFIRNDENYVKCLDRWMSWKDKQIKPANGRTNGIDAEWQAIKIAVGQPGRPDISENALRAVQGVPGGWRRFKEQDARFMDQLKPLFEEAYARTNQQPATA
jgi:hypothetical protein